LDISIAIRYDMDPSQAIRANFFAKNYRKGLKERLDTIVLKGSHANQDSCAMTLVIALDIVVEQ